jgi:hypothetical protein
MLHDTYMAGLFDGEGYISTNLYRREGHLDRITLTVGISMTTPAPLRLVKEKYGGNLFCYARPNPNHRPLWQWVITSTKGAAFLRIIEPYLIVKRLECELALELQDDIDKWRHNLAGHSPRKSPVNWRHPEAEAVIARRHEMRKRLRELKHISHS